MPLPSEFPADRVDLAFGSADPPLARLPHCLFEQSEEALKLILSAAGCLGGLWPRDPIVDASGDRYMGEGGDIDDFRLWELPENQSDLLRYGPYCFLEIFTMVIDSSTKREVLLKIREGLAPLFTDADGTFHTYQWYGCIDALPLLMDDLGWAYMPLGGVDESGYAIFVTSPRRETLFHDASLRLREAGIVVGDVDHFRRTW